LSDAYTSGDIRHGFPGHNARVDLRTAIPLTPVKLGDEDGGVQFFGVAMNISRSGIFVQTPTFIDVGKVFRIEFTLPKTGTAVKCLSKVVWNRSLSFNRAGVTRGGLKFLDVDTDVLDRIDECVRTQTANGKPS
jgi:Tfp pilus assembly protein PilZ